MEFLSVTDMFKVGRGPSSSHTLGPWRAALAFLELKPEESQFISITITLYGSLSLTGLGHATDKAVILGLAGLDPVSAGDDEMEDVIFSVMEKNLLRLGSGERINFEYSGNIIFSEEFLDFHANALEFTGFLSDGNIIQQKYYSIGGGFISEGKTIETLHEPDIQVPHPIETASQLLHYCHKESRSIADIVWYNEKTLRAEQKVRNDILEIWEVMLESIYQGCHTEGVLPGGLNVKRRAPSIFRKLHPEKDYSDRKSWFQKIKKQEFSISSIFKWVSCFALAVNEQNAAMGRVVTAPTNGSAGVIPAVLMFYLTHYNHQAGDDDIIQFLCVASEIGCIFKKGATISAAMGGCQAEIGVSSAMAAAGLAHVLGGSPEQCVMAAEVAMEHHLGLTCDPVKGLVQVPCIERNAMGAIKAINAAELAIESDPNDAKVPLDKVVLTMWETAKDMHRKYKETSEGGLAVAVNLIEC